MNISFFIGLLLAMHGLIMCSFALTHQDFKDGIVMNGGRKVLIKKLETAKAGGANEAGEVSEIMISGGTTTRDHGNTSEEKRGFDGIYDAKVLLDNASTTKGYKKVDEDGFVDFNTDDYNEPKRHPPKHN